MVIGIDVGGTNTDAAIIGENFAAFKLPNEVGMSEVLKEISKKVDLAKEKVVVSTSLPLNLVISKFSEIKTLPILIPGPGLNYSNYGFVVKGFVNHRGELVEDIDEEEIEELLKSKQYENIAIAAKFSPRNSILEEKIKKIASRYIEESRIACSYHVGSLNYPARINTTLINAKTKPIVYDLTTSIKKFVKEFYYFTGDGGIVPDIIAVENPSLLYNSSAAAVAVGASFLTGEKDALIIDVGGTSTDFVLLKDGMPKITDCVEIYGKKTLIRCADSVSIPFGGDSLINERIKPVRLDKPIAFGGKYFTFTDALNCLGYEIGDYRKSRDFKKDFDCEGIFDQFISVASEVVSMFEADKIVAAGYLSPILVPEIAKRCGIKCIVPEHYGVVNAIGVAVSKISLQMYARYDTEKGIASFNGKLERCPFRIGKIPEKEEILDVTISKLYEIARSIGADESEFGNPKILYFNSYTIVRGNMRRGLIADVVAQLEPGIRYELRRLL